ncbi:MAG: hypothetical protein JO227_21905, partial [Acetobacteraceae bacterium]|nr:hypothetical protein [Acetobacteraceae bacterium]
APPFRQVEFDIMYGEGISKVGEILDLGVKAGIVEKSGAWFSYDSQRIGQIKERDEVTGNQTRVKVVKNKLAPPFRQVEFDIMYGEGISKVGELIDLGVKANVVEKSGAWFSYDSQRIGQGRENAKQFLRDHKEVAAAIETKVREQSGMVANTMLAAMDEDEEAEAAE